MQQNSIEELTFEHGEWHPQDKLTVLYHLAYGVRARQNPKTAAGDARVAKRFCEEAGDEHLKALIPQVIGVDTNEQSIAEALPCGEALRLITAARSNLIGAIEER